MSDHATTSTEPNDSRGLMFLRLMWETNTLLNPDFGLTDDEKRVYREANSLKFLHKRIRQAAPGTAYTYIATVNSRPPWTGANEFDRGTLQAVERIVRDGYTHDHRSGQSEGYTGKDVQSMSSIEPFPVPSKEQLRSKEDLPTDTILRQVFAKVIADDEMPLEEVRKLMGTSQEGVNNADDHGNAATATATAFGEPAPVTFTVDLATQEGANYDDKVTAVTYVFSRFTIVADSDSEFTDESSETDFNSQGDASDNGDPDAPDPMDVDVGAD